MKKLAFLIAALLMVCIIATACGNDEGNTSVSSSSEATTTSSSSSSSSSSVTTTTSSSSSSSSSQPTNPSGTKYELKDSLSATDVFSFAANVVVDTSGAKAAVVNGSSLSLTSRAKLGGKFQLSVDKGFIKIQAPASGTLTVVLMSSSGSDATRSVDLFDSSGSKISTSPKTAQAEGNTLTVDAGGIHTFTISAAGTYYIGSEANALNVYYMCLQC